jgi:GT2 family glycosyltransferase
LDLSIIIVNWNTSALLRQCLKSVYDTTPRFVFEIIVVDNASSDESTSMVEEQFPSVVLIKNIQNVGFAPANNQGMDIAKGRYVMLLNSDTIVLPGALDTLMQITESHPEIGVIGPQLLNIDNTVQKSWSRFPTLWSELLGINFRQRKPVEGVPHAYDVDWIGGACMLVQTKTMEDVGKLDADYFFYSEEMDWCYRIKQKGWKIWYLSNAQIHHLGGGSSNRASLKQLLLLYRSKLLYFKKHHGRMRTTLLRYGFVLVNALGVIRRMIFFNWRKREMALQRISNQSKLVWYLLVNRYPNMPGLPNNW